MSGLPPFATELRTSLEVRIVPGRDSCTATNCIPSDHLVGAGDQCEWHTDAEQLASSGAADINADSVDHSAGITRGFPFSMMKAL